LGLLSKEARLKLSRWRAVRSGAHEARRALSRTA
ncbi:glycosyltransferase family 2 protein, partial [Mesorhizobium sp. M00.F.Ca.ET.216.01.1.1]